MGWGQSESHWEVCGEVAGLKKPNVVKASQVLKVSCFEWFLVNREHIGISHNFILKTHSIHQSSSVTQSSLCTSFQAAVDILIFLSFTINDQTFSFLWSH